jgi:hypothetical protein
MTADSIDRNLVYKTTSQPVTEPAETPTSWWQWTDQRISRELEAICESVGGIFCEERAYHRREIEKATEPLKREIAELHGQVKLLRHSLQPMLLARPSAV